MRAGRPIEGARANSAQVPALAVAALAVIVFMGWSAARIHGLLAVLYQNSDIASAPVMAELLDERGSSTVTLGYYLWLEPLYMLHLSGWLPEHRVVWEAIPFVIYGATLALVAWTVRRAVSTAAGIAVALAMAAPAPQVIWLLAAPNMRLLTLAHAVLLATFVVTIPAMARASRGWRLVWAAALTLTLAAGASSDPLLIIGGALPFLIAVGAGRLLGLVPARPAALAAAAAAAGVLGGKLIERLAEEERIVYDERSFGLASPGDLISNAGLLFEDVALFFHGRLGTGGLIGGVLEATAWAAFAAVPLLCALALLRARRALGERDGDPARRLLALYWGAGAAAVTLAFVASDAAEDISAIRYMFVLWPALLTLGVIAWPRRAPFALAALATATAVLGCWQLAENRYASGDPRSPQGDEVAELRELVADKGLEHGYAGYWDAAALTAQTGFESRTYPVIRCGPGGRARCVFPYHTIGSWYEPRPGVRTYYVESDTGLPIAVGPPPSSWGPPSERVVLDHLTVYIYDYDLARVLLPAPR